MVEERLSSAKYKILFLRVRVFVYCLLAVRLSRV